MPGLFCGGPGGSGGSGGTEEDKGLGTTGILDTNFMIDKKLKYELKNSRAAE